tara:strand:+ start:746 stop:1252 length:507 start_codon:yes stop_codon:yes gene_type:complete
MNAAHLHLLINHLPIIGSFIGFLLIFYSAIIIKNRSNLKAGLVILSLSCISILPVYFSGESAEDIVEHLNVVKHDTIEEHEEIAELGLYVSLFVCLLSSATFFAINRNNKQANNLTYITLFMAVLLTVLFVLIGHTGGEIRHTEIEQNTDSSIEKTRIRLNIQDTDGD